MIAFTGILEKHAGCASIHGSIKSTNGVKSDVIYVCCFFSSLGWRNTYPSQEESLVNSWLKTPQKKCRTVPLQGKIHKLLMQLSLLPSPWLSVSCSTLWCSLDLVYINFLVSSPSEETLCYHVHWISCQTWSFVKSSQNQLVPVYLFLFSIYLVHVLFQDNWYTLKWFAIF